MDAPAYIAWRDLMKTYPEAKVVLTVRDADSWYDSLRKTILAEGFIDQLMTTDLAPMLGPMLGAMMADAGLPAPPPDAPMGPPPREAMMAMREGHVAAVMREVPSERLLVFHVSEGWDPLCRFLGVETPGRAFPRVNDAESFHTTFAVPSAAG